MSAGHGWLFWALASAVFAALTAIFAKAGLADIDPDLATLIRTAIILALLGLFVVSTGKWVRPAAMSPRTIGLLVLSAVATGASWICYFRALQLGRASEVAPVDKLSVILVALFAFAFLGERPTLQGWAGIALVAAGVGLLAWSGAGPQGRG